MTKENEPTEKPEQTEQVWENTLVLCEHLQRQGFKIGKSKMYRDRRAGILRVEPDGVVLPHNARAYALTLRKVGASPITLEKINEQKSRKEVERLTLEVEKLQFSLDRERGKFLLREDFIMEMSARAAVLDLGLRHLVNTKVPEWLRLVNGDSTKAGLLMDVLNRDIDELLNDFATLDKFQVVFIAE